MSLHYRADGGLDMRYSSSKAAASSGFSCGGGSSSQSMTTHFTKSGTPDHRYSENRTYGCNTDGSADRRCNAHVSRPSIPKSSTNTSSSTLSHLTKSGNPDHRYSENRTHGYNTDGSTDRRCGAQVSKPSISKSSTSSTKSNTSHLTKSGELDHRFKENRVKGKNMNGTNDQRCQPHENKTTHQTNPKHDPLLTKSGRPDYRYKANRIQGKNKDGSDDMRFTVNRPNEQWDESLLKERYDIDSLMDSMQCLYEDVDVSNEAFHSYEEAEGKEYPIHSADTCQAIICSEPDETSNWDDSIFDLISERLDDDSNWRKKDFSKIEIGVVDATINVLIKKKRMKIVTKKITSERLLEQWDAIQENGYPQCYVDIAHRTLSQILNEKGKSIIEEDLIQ